MVAGAGTWKLQAWRYDSRELARVEQQRETETMRRKAANSAAGGHEADKTTIRTRFEVITEKVEHEIQTERVVYDRTCLADGGLRQLADAARATGYAGEPVHPLPAASASK